MGIFDKIFKSKNQEIIIDLKDNSLYLNDVAFELPTSPEKLITVLGEPSQKYAEQVDVKLIWDHLGICADAYLDKILHFRLIVHPEPRLKHLPKGLFKGKVLINGKSVANFPEGNIKINKNQVTKGRYMRDDSNPIYAYIISNNLDYAKAAVDPNKYKQNKNGGNKINFVDFNFKLAIIQELMYNLEVLTPKFDLYEFVELYKNRKIDIEEEGYEPIPEVMQYFEELEISTDLAQLVTEIYQDGGNEIYGNVIRFWSGEDDLCDIQSFEDTKHFPNLKKMTLFSGVKEETMQQLRAQGIVVELL